MLWELFNSPSNIIFSISLALMLLLGITELILMLVGASAQGFLDQFLPEQLLDVKHPELNFSDHHDGLWIKTLDWLYLGRIPILVWFIIFLTVYSLTGFITQIILFKIFGSYLSAWLISPLCLFLAMPLVRYSSKFIAKILPQDETTAIHSEELIGRTALIILGEAKINYPAQAKVKDQHGLTHYVLVEPQQDITLKMGQQVILTEKTTIGFKATTFIEQRAEI
ncbi:YqiJ family protein [Acinetobacter larvae]|uniref:DUF1449 domain-containing protein n=1 Tax=Acinetobacter larvae TaxID=1789224 RepID=A0A1B2LXQ7_9GAMM|nr:YqiJ family protein [Acinetobacter larvae]AOA57721.1 hypothetical protein BFG52_04680 [Acinetobacter larvae]